MTDRQFTPEEIAAATQVNYQRLADAMRMVREAIETAMGGAAKLPASEQFSTAYEECEAFAHAIARFAAGRMGTERLLVRSAAQTPGLQPYCIRADLTGRLRHSDDRDDSFRAGAAPAVVPAVALHGTPASNRRRH